MPDSGEVLSERELEILRWIAAGWSNQDIAGKLVISLNTVRWYNKQIYGKLAVHSRTLAVARATELGLVGKRGGRADDLPEGESAGVLPLPLTSFVGRTEEICALRDSLLRDDVRLVTLSGPPGVGKTRLSLEGGHTLKDSFAHGVFFVGLAPVRSADSVIQAVAAALGIGESLGEPVVQAVKRAIHKKRLLLILDNFEHVVEAAPVVADLLASAPGLKILITSRETLRLSAEHDLPLAPLATPDLTASDVESCESVMLFAQRARSVKPDFALNEANAATVAQICVRLDGLPLAIELATARLRLLTPQALLERLNTRLGILTQGPRDLPQRQQTLRATIDWSYDLLTADEQKLLARLSVFAGGCTLEAAGPVSGDPDVLVTLEALVLKSLVQHAEGPSGAARFTMLETIREYAAERLEASGEAEQVRALHADAYLRFTEQAQHAFWEPEQQYWVRRQAEEHENVRAALITFEAQGQVEGRMRLLGALTEFMFARSHFVEGWQWAEAAVADDHAAVGPVVTGRVYLLLNVMAYALGKFQRSIEAGNIARDLFREVGDTYHEGVALFFNSAPTALLGDLAAAIRLAEDGRSLIQAAGRHDYIPLLLANLGNYYLGSGDTARGQAALEEGLLISRQTGNHLSALYNINALAGLALQSGNDAQAEVLCSEVFALCRVLGETRMYTVAVFWLALLRERANGLEEAFSLYQQGVMLSYRTLDAPLLIRGLIRLSALQQKQGRLDEAEDYAYEAVETCLDNDDASGSIHAIAQYARVMARQGELPLAAQLFAAASREMDAAHFYEVIAIDPAPDIEALRQAMPADTFEAAWQDGLALAPADALDHILRKHRTLRDDV